MTISECGRQDTRPDIEPPTGLADAAPYGARYRLPLLGHSQQDVVERAKADRAAAVLAALGHFATWMKSQLRSRSPAAGTSNEVRGGHDA